METVKRLRDQIERVRKYVPVSDVIVFFKIVSLFFSLSSWAVVLSLHLILWAEQESEVNVTLIKSSREGRARICAVPTLNRLCREVSI